MHVLQKLIKPFMFSPQDDSFDSHCSIVVVEGRVWHIHQYPFTSWEPKIVLSSILQIMRASKIWGPSFWMSMPCCNDLISHITWFI